MESVGGTVSSRAWLNAKRQVSPVVYEDAAGTKVMKVHVNAHFENWGLTVANTPALTFVPTTVLGISNIVKWAKLNGKRVRASGYRHTWTDMYSADNEVLVSMLDIETVTTIPDPTSLEKTAEFPGNELKVIELEPTDVPGSGGKKRLVRIGAAVTNEELRRWSVANDAWSMAVNVIMVEITLGGSNVPICHGAGLRHKTVSDIVRKISYVDANGNPQTVDGSNPELLRAAAGSFGLLGVITHITFELDKMTYAVMKPEKTNVNLAIPPPADYTVPPALQKFYFPSQLSAARAEFVNKANTKYFSEWFWFPYQDEVFVNCWDTTTDRTGVKDYPSPPDVFLQWLQGWIGGVLNDDPLWRALPGLWQATILGTLAHTSQPPYGPLDTEIRTYLTDALHFRRGIQNMRVRDMELQIPIPPLASDPTKPDYGIVQRAWWDAILETYKDPRAPMRIALELRIMGGSDMIMAPQRGNGFGTASIEVVTSMAAAADGSWMPFAQRLADKWMALRDGAGVRLKTRPHWAKEWDWMKVDGMPWKDYLRTVSYKDEIPQFLQAVSDIGSSQGWTVADAKARFSVGLLDDVFFG
ncbi:hypothetical protein DFH27DRAFT_485502 [Peziza echinospora]|nr:hypothetical protein DFH27DRAFT_485502 [Peziza echinospora]